MSMYVVQANGDTVAWVIKGKMSFEEVVNCVEAIRKEVSKIKQVSGRVRILVDNTAISQEGATAYPANIAEKWGELQQWFVATLSEGDRIAVIQGSATMKMQMTRLGRQIGLDKFEQHFFEKTYEETKRKAYEYLGITSNPLVDKLATVR
jgi:hypothetical protein